MHQPEETTSTQIYKVFKLSNGETIIASIVKETPSYVEIDKPFKLIGMVNSEGNLNLGIYKWDYTIDYSYSTRLFKNSIVAVSEPTKNMTHTYLDMISTSEIFKDYIPEEDDEDDENEDRKEELLTDLLNRFNSDKIH
jgi:hypothetical protein